MWVRLGRCGHGHGNGKLCHVNVIANVNVNGAALVCTLGMGTGMVGADPGDCSSCVIMV